jgi:hypothetical protein
MANLDTKDKNPARVTYSVGFTRNLGNWQSVKINVGLTVDDTDDDLDATFKATREKVVEWFHDAMAEVDDDVKDWAKKNKK